MLFAGRLEIPSDQIVTSNKSVHCVSECHTREKVEDIYSRCLPRNISTNKRKRKTLSPFKHMRDTAHRTHSFHSLHIIVYLLILK